MAQWVYPASVGWERWICLLPCWECHCNQGVPCKVGISATSKVGALRSKALVHSIRVRVRIGARVNTASKGHYCIPFQAELTLIALDLDRDSLSP